MRWDAVLDAVGELAAADADLAARYPDEQIRQAGTGAKETPLLEFLLIADAETELWAPCTVQWNIWEEDHDELIAAERRLRLLFDRELFEDFAGVRMWASYVDGETLARPDRDGYYGRAVRFRFTPLRERYDASTP